MQVTVAGAGPAGTSAAISARLLGAEVTLFDPASFPRQKVCGEFLSPEVIPLLEQLGVLEGFRALRPQCYRALEVHFPGVSKSAVLPEPAYGLSRSALDQLLLERALKLGTAWRRERAGAARVQATGRNHATVRGGRLFGFKAHYRGPASDSMALFFFGGCYVGVNAVEGGVTNVCGLGPEETLGRYGFEPDAMLAGFVPLAARLRPLARSTPWLRTGPLCFSRSRLHERRDDGVLWAGDGLQFVDPFTGSGMLAAMISGISAGMAAARGESAAMHMARCRRALGMPAMVSSVFRWGIGNGLANRVVRWLPLGALMQSTRPGKAQSIFTKN